MAWLGLLAVLAAQAGIAVEAALAVWSVESGPFDFLPGRPVLRFEAHKFWIYWGKDNAEAFDRHFQFGGRAGVAGSSWSNQKYSVHGEGHWEAFHGDQYTEYLAFDLAALLGGIEAACLASSFGGPQIMGFNHGHLGYENAAVLFRAFGGDERWQVCGFFDFCEAHGILEALRQQDWLKFAAVYNGPGQAAAYGKLIAGAHDVAVQLLQDHPRKIQ